MKTPVNICVWWEAAGWLWDDAQDHGGFDRVSPMGPYSDKASAQADAEKAFDSVVFFDGRPDHYALD